MLSRSSQHSLDSFCLAQPVIRCGPRFIHIHFIFKRSDPRIGENNGGRFSYLDLMVGNPSATNEKLISFFTWTFCFRFRLRLGYGWDLFHCHFLYVRYSFVVFVIIAVAVVIFLYLRSSYLRAHVRVCVLFMCMMKFEEFRFVIFILLWKIILFQFLPCFHPLFSITYFFPRFSFFSIWFFCFYWELFTFILWIEMSKLNEDANSERIQNYTYNERRQLTKNLIANLKR